MMKTRFCPIVLLSLPFLASCQQQIDSPALPDNAFQLIAVQDPGDDTKTIISGETSVYWEPAEEIKVFKADGTGYLFKSSNTEPAATALFSGVLTTDDVTEGEELWSVYPFAEEATFDGENITTVLPSSQVARAESFGRNMNLSIARTTSRQLQFYNVGGGIRFSVTQEGISKVIFEGLNGEILSGKVTVGFENGRPVVKEVSGGSPFITLTPPDGETFQTGKWYFIVTIPGALSGGYKLRFYKADDYARRVSDTPVTIKRGIYGSLARADASIEYESTTTSFPESEEEIEKSIDMSEAIASISQSIIDNVKESSSNGEIYAKAIAEELEQIEGVESAIPTELGTSIVVKQTNGVYINVILQSFADDFDSSTKSLGPVSGSQPASSKAGPRRNGTNYSSGKKALILMPVYDEAMSCFMQFDIYNYGYELYGHFKQYLENCGYEVEECLNQKATLELFRGKNLQNYDFVFIHSHGGYDLRPVNGTGEYTGWMTASKVIEDTGKRFFSVTDYCDESIGAYDGKLHYWITSEAIKRDQPSFNDTFFYIFACHGAKKEDMYSYLFERGAIAYCGHTDKANKLGSPVVAEQMLYALTSGLSLEKAYEWTLHHSFKYDGSVPNWDLSHFDYLQREYDEPINLVDPRPYDLQRSVSGDLVKLTWNQSPTSGDYRYSVVIDGINACYNADTSKELTISSLEPGTYSWYVQADLLLNGTVVESFSSQPGPSFTIEQTTQQGEPIISVSSSSLSFGSLAVGQQAEQTLIIKNTGDTDLTISSIDTPDGFSTNFNLWNNNVIAASGGEHQLKVFFNPTLVKTYGGDLVITSNSSVSATVSLSGNGIANEMGKAIIKMPFSVDMGYGIVGKGVSKDVYISNIGNATLNITDISFQIGQGDFNWKSGSIAPGDSLLLRVYFNHSQIGPFNQGLVVVSSNASNENYNETYFWVSCIGQHETPSYSKEWKDLGLSVKWATCDLGSSSPYEFGEHYAWGETDRKTSYTWSNYLWCDGTEDSITKYSWNDSKYRLDAEDDAATAHLGSGWRIPTKQECKELIDNCDWTVEETDDKTFFRATSRLNGNSIVFILHNGYNRYWTSNLFSDSSAYDFSMSVNDEIHPQWCGGSGYFRCVGQCVRPVFDQ